METNLFYQGIRPAISVGLSVSRVGGSAQTKAVKSVAGNLRLSLAQFRELAAFSQFSTDLDEETKQRIERGQRLTELLKQPQYSPLSVWQQTSLLMAANEGAFDSVSIDNIKKAKYALLSALHSQYKKEMTQLDKGDKPDDKIQKIIVNTANEIAKEYNES
jgi:F-type H+-transporting ATPase subunit alpha